MPSFRRSGRSRGIGAPGDGAHLGEEARRAARRRRSARSSVSRRADELVLPVAEHRLDGRRVVADREIGREEHDDVARVLDERAEPLGALPLVQILGVASRSRARARPARRASRRPRALASTAARACGRRARRPHRSTASGISAANCAGARPRPAPATTSSVDAGARPPRPRLADDLVRGVDRDAVDVVSRPGRTRAPPRRRRARARVAPSARGERRGPASRTITSAAERRAGADDDEELARPGADRRDGEHRRRGQRGGREDGEPPAG